MRLIQTMACMTRALRRRSQLMRMRVLRLRMSLKERNAIQMVFPRPFGCLVIVRMTVNAWSPLHWSRITSSWVTYLYKLILLSTVDLRRSRKLVRPKFGLTKCSTGNFNRKMSHMRRARTTKVCVYFGSPPMYYRYIYVWFKIFEIVQIC